MANTSRVILYGFWASSCSWRVRAALHFKGIPFEERNIDITQEMKNLTDEYRAICPSQKVPAIFIDGETVVESMAILQYLEETHPEPALTPATPLLRARMREVCETIVSGIQPLQNYALKRQFPTEEQYIAFTRYNCERGLDTLEDLLQKTAGKYCVGDQITMADLCLVPQVNNFVTRHKMKLDGHKTVHKIYETLSNEKLFQQTNPKNVKLKLEHQNK